MAVRHAPPAPADLSAFAIRPLRVEDIPALRVRDPQRLSAAALRAIVADYPERSVWLPATSEYVVLAPWRHRREVAVLQEIAAVGNAEAMIAAAVERSRRAGDVLTLAIEMDETRPPAFYRRAGLAPLEEIVTYEFELGACAPWRADGRLDFRPVRPLDPDHLAALLRIDHAAFPWLWWNSEAEFRAYHDTPGVQLYLGFAASRPVAYAGVTTYAGWGHLDRMAVVPEAQGGGLGREALAFAIATLARHGARRVALSTQRDNVRSQRLYEGFGFRRSPAFDYRLFAAAHRPPAPGAGEPGSRGAEENGSTARLPDSPTPALEER